MLAAEQALGEHFVFLQLRGCLPQHHTDQTSARFRLFPKASSVAVPPAPRLPTATRLAPATSLRTQPPGSMMAP